MTGFSSTDQAAIITFMGELYQQICDIETRFRMLIGGPDMRPRIDYFHDAVRDFTAGIESRRLRVESLAYDVQMLRYLTQTPLAPLQPGGHYQSPSQSVVASGPALVENTSRPDRTAKQQLSESYQKYGVLFAALLRPVADLDFRERTDVLNDEVRDIHSIIQQLESGRANLSQVQAQAQQLETAELRALLNQFLQAGKHKLPPEVKKLVAFLKSQIQQRDKALKTLDKTHMDAAMAQLGLFEDSKDMIKSLANKGMNLVGRFVQASISETRRQMGR